MYSHFLRGILCIPLILLSISLQAQFLESQKGASSMGMAYADLCSTGSSGIFNNPASMIGSKASIGSHIVYRYQLMEMSTYAAFINLPLKKIHIGIGAEQFGDRIYQESSVNLNIGYQMGNVKVAFRERILHQYAEHYWSRWNLVSDLGVIMPLNSKLYAGVYINQFIVQNNQTESKLTPEAYLGIRYDISSKVITHLSVAKNFQEEDIEFRLGMESSLHEHIKIRAGVSSLKSLHMGSTLQFKKLNFNYAVSVHELLPYTHQLSISYYISKV